MPQPTRGTVHVNRPLTNISVAFIQAATDFIADQVFPQIGVPSKSDSYFTYDKAYWQRSQAQRRAPSTESAGGGYTIGTDDYNADVFAFHKDIDDQIRENADSPIALDREATIFVTRQLLLQKEVAWASSFFTTSVWDTDLLGVSGAPAGGQFQQFNEAASDPIGVVSTARIAVKRETGFTPNTLVVSEEVHETLKNHPDIVERVKYTSAAAITQAIIANLFEVDRYIVAGAVQETATEGATSSMAFVSGKNMLLCYTPPSPGIMTPAAGYTFQWTGMSGAGGAGIRVKRFRMEHLESDRVEAEFAYDHKVVSSSLGYFFSAAVA